MTTPRGRSGLASLGAQITNANASASSNLILPPSRGHEPSSLAAPLELTRGLDNFVQQLGNMGASNLDLQRRLELQHREFSMLQATSIDQQRQILNFEQRAEAARRSDAQAAEARVQAAEARVQARALQTEKRLIADLEECRRRIQQKNKEHEASDIERDRERDALKQELELARRQLARETEARRSIEGAAAEREKQHAAEAAAAAERQRELQELLEKAANQLLQFRQQISEQDSQLKTQEVEYADIEARYKRHRRKARQLLSNEKEKLGVVARLDGMLPTNILLKAVA
eukprot:TRINITY_DN92325_c0_g1_i1.p1 TRINITY_DN92325_c0_g1~~TRINITY_DN92325_c0_g1_i1.p1  ORF type:complete len:289 (+),score=69.44 TRINITY_DN92325_c0_g1_i1:79-945(+)